MRVSLIKYQGGNILSVVSALNRLGISPLVTDDPETIQGSDRVVFPGVGEASSAMRSLRENALDQVLNALTQPVLGICLGMQLLCRYSEENSTETLGIIPQTVKRFSGPVKVPHVGWNTVAGVKGGIFNGIPENSFFYFVHSYFVESGEYELASCEYGGTFSAAVQRDNFYGVQFHPEKSGDTGLKLLENFLKL